MNFDEIDKCLLNDYQRDFPLDSRPYQLLADRFGVSEDEIINRLSRLQEEGYISRIGGIFTPNKVGASLLAAMKVPAARMTDVVPIINSYEGINHNYEREHAYNLWFVATAPDDAQLEDLLTNLETDTGLSILRLPLVEAYHIDLGFEIQWN